MKRSTFWIVFAVLLFLGILLYASGRFDIYLSAWPAICWPIVYFLYWLAERKGLAAHEKPLFDYDLLRRTCEDDSTKK